MPSLQGIWEPAGIGRGHFCSILVLRVMMSIEWKAVRREPKRRGQLNGILAITAWVH